jgi:S-adenosyl-L-methionine hydrolase (adenosine-forming)
MPGANIITVLTDFGLKDPYVGIMKGVILSINPEATMVDVSHDVEPQDIKDGAFLVPEYYPFFPEGSIHLCVIDPTVGSSRKGLIVTKEGHIFVGPDNGLFTFLLDGAEVHEISNQALMLPRISSTFHGRDIFAPAAAHLSRGTMPFRFGPAVTSPVRLSDLVPSLEGNTLTGEIIHIDRFGNLLSNIDHRLFMEFVGDRPFLIEVGRLSFSSLNKSYYEDRYTCLVGSSGYLEFGFFGGNLALQEGAGKDDPVRITRN